MNQKIAIITLMASALLLLTAPGFALAQADTVGATLNLAPCIGKGFPAYAKVLGKPAKVTNDTSSQNHGQNRVYMNATLKKKGVTRINASAYELIESNPKAVTWLEIVFKKDSGMTWEKALAFIGAPTTNVTTHTGTGTINNLPYQSLLLDGVSFPGVPLAKILTENYIRSGEGWSVTWFDKYPTEKNAPVLKIEYVPFEM